MPTTSMPQRKSTIGPTQQDFKTLSDKVNKALAEISVNDVQLTSDSQSELDSRIAKLEQGLTDLTSVPAKVAALEKKAAAQANATKLTALDKKVSALEAKLKKLTLSSLTDVNIQGAQANAILSYDTSTKTWVSMNEE